MCGHARTHTRTRARTQQQQQQQISNGRNAKCLIFETII